MSHAESIPQLNRKTSCHDDSSATWRTYVAVAAFAVHLCVAQSVELIKCSGTKYALLADDSLITLSVARNIAVGIGPYINRSDHTSAATSFIWPMMLAPIFKLEQNLTEAAFTISVLSQFLCFIVFFVIARTASTIRTAALATISSAVCTPFLAYGSSGWEHIPQAIFVTAGLCLLWKKKAVGKLVPEIACLLCLGVASLFRLDALPMLAAALGLCVASSCKRSQKLWTTSVGSAICAILLLERIAHYRYFGAFLPNSFYLKIHPGWQSFDLGAQYLIGDALYTVVPIAFLIAVLGTALCRHNRTPEILVIIGIIAIQIIYIICVGGDVFPAGRFLLVLAPIVFLLAWETIARLRDQLRGWAELLLIILLLRACIVFELRQNTVTRQTRDGQLVTPQDAQVAQTAMIGYIRSHFKPNDGALGLAWLGTLTYYLPEYECADFLGKADPVIARGPVNWGPIGHNKWNINYTIMAHHIALIPVEDRDFARSVLRLQQHAPNAYWDAIATDPTVNKSFTYLSPKQLGWSSAWGLYVRNDLLYRIAANSTQPGGSR